MLCDDDFICLVSLQIPNWECVNYCKIKKNLNKFSNGKNGDKDNCSSIGSAKKSKCVIINNDGHIKQIQMDDE